MNMRDLFLSSAYVLCIHCYPFLWIVLSCLRLMSCVSNVTRFSELTFFVFALCLVYPLFPVSLNCPFLSSSYVLCIQCYQYFWIVHSIMIGISVLSSIYQKYVMLTWPMQQHIKIPTPYGDNHRNKDLSWSKLLC